VVRMKIQKCPFCGSSRTSRSPSGEHLLCLVCQRILIVPRQKAPPEMSEEAKEPETEKKAVAGAGG